MRVIKVCGLKSAKAHLFLNPSINSRPSGACRVRCILILVLSAHTASTLEHDVCIGVYSVLKCIANIFPRALAYRNNTCILLL